MAGSRLYHAVVAVGIIVCVVQCQVAAQEAGGSREVRAIIRQPSPAGFILTRHMWDDLDASTDPIVQASSKRFIQTTVSSEDGKLTVSGAASVFANPFWAAERIGRARGALPKPTEFRLGVSLYEAQVARLRDWRRTIENTLSVAVVTVLGPQAGVAAWLALEVHAHSVWAGDNIIRFRLPLTRLPGRVQPHDSAMTVDVAQVVATHCADRGCGGKNTTTMAQLAAHLRCAQRMLQRLDDARAVAPEGAPGLPSWAPVTFSVVDGRQVCGATIAVPLSHEGVGFAAGVDAQVDGFSAQHGVSDTVRQRLRATARAQATFSSPLVGPDVEVATSAFPTGSPTEAVPVLVEHLKKSWAHAEAGVSRLATEVLQMPGMSAQQNRHLMNNLCSLHGTRCRVTRVCAPRVLPSGSRSPVCVCMRLCRYLEIGSYQGSTLVSCVYGNGAAVDNAVAIDTFQISNPAALEHHLEYESRRCPPCVCMY